jgi:hypothetical protein
MRLAAAAFALFAVVAQGETTVVAGDLTLTLPRSLRAGEAASIEVEVGAIGRNQIEVKTASGEALGTISPYGIRFGEAAGTYTLPLPQAAVRDGRVSVRLTISQPGAPPRAPTAEEVRSVRLTVGGGAR